MNLNDIDRFWDKTMVDDDNKCWEWIGGINSTGRGIFHLNGKSIHAHRASWIIKYGDIPEKMSVLHKCDNGKCINPFHLFLGTQKDNMHDMIGKGRKVIRRGDDDPKSKLTEKDVRLIKELYVPKVFSQFKLAKMFNVSRSAILAVLNGSNWRHVT